MAGGYLKKTIKEGDMICIKIRYLNLGKTMIDGKWVDIPNTKCQWLTDYRKASLLDVRVIKYQIEESILTQK